MYSTRRQKQNKHKRIKIIIPAVTIFILACYVTIVSFLPLGAIPAQIVEQPTIPADTPALDWPSYGQSALYAEGYGPLDTNGDQATIPIASITKIVTALTILRSKPINDISNSPSITFNQDDVDIYNRYLSQDGVVAPVTPGNTISQYDMLQIMLVASANNYAETMAIWAFGSVDAYLVAANDYLASQDLSNTAVQDPAGFSTGSKSTAADLARLGQIALDNSIVADIVAEPSVTVPGYGTFYTTNILVANGTAIGVKTGNTDEAGQCLLFAQRSQVDGANIVITGAILGGESKSQVAGDASALLQSGFAGFETRQYAKKDQVFAVYESPWGSTSQLISKAGADTVVWTGDESTTSVTAPPIDAGQATVSSAKATNKNGEHVASTALSLDKPIEEPSLLWRLTHPVELLRM